MKELLTILAKGLVEKPDDVSVTEKMVDDTLILHLHVAPDDMGRVIGKQGRIAKAIRIVMRSAASRTEKKIMVEIDN